MPEIFLESRQREEVMGNIQGQFISLAIQTFKVTLLVSLPILAIALIVGLLVSIFQATTQINEMTLSFVPKAIAVIAVMLFAMPWMLTTLIDYTKHLFDLIPTFIN